MGLSKQLEQAVLGEEVSEVGKQTAEIAKKYLSGSDLKRWMSGKIPLTGRIAILKKNGAGFKDLEAVRAAWEKDTGLKSGF